MKKKSKSEQKIEDIEKSMENIINPYLEYPFRCPNGKEMTFLSQHIETIKLQLHTLKKSPKKAPLTSNPRFSPSKKK